MIDSVNRTIAKNVITIEDPVEFLYRDKKSTSPARGGLVRRPSPRA